MSHLHIPITQGAAEITPWFVFKNFTNREVFLPHLVSVIYIRINNNSRVLKYFLQRKLQKSRLKLHRMTVYNIYNFFFFIHSTFCVTSKLFLFFFNSSVCLNIYIDLSEYQIINIKNDIH